MMALLVTIAATTAPASAPWHPETHRALVKAAAFRAKGQISAEAALLEGVRLGRTRVVAEDAEAAKAVEEGVAIWRAALPDSPFVAVSSGAAEVKVRFVDFVEGPEGMGRVEARRDYWFGGGHGSKLTGSIVIRRTVGARPIRADEAAAVLAHELGHLLGLDDVTEVGPIMGPLLPGSPTVVPTKAEVDSILHLRELCRTDGR
ncbi:hypothetical protein EON79_19780 [bacterium]|nr:MAG: hypothetical protein EON79_19780 [bacterium]